MGNKVRIWYWPDGQISVSHPELRESRKPKKFATMAEYHDWQLNNVSVKSPQFRGLDYEDVDSSQIPDKDKNRLKWTGSKGQGIRIDNAITLPYEIENNIRAELGKPVSDVSKVLKLQLDLKDKVAEMVERRKTTNKMIPKQGNN